MAEKNKNTAPDKTDESPKKDGIVYLLEHRLEKDGKTVKVENIEIVAANEKEAFAQLPGIYANAAEKIDGKLTYTGKFQIKK